MILTILPCKRHKNEEAWQIRHAFPACHKNVSVSIRQGMLHDILAFLRRNAHMSVRGGVMRITSTSCEFVMPTTGGPMCPLGGDTVRFPPIYGEFVMSATGGHMGPPLRRYGRTCKIEYSLRSPQGRPPFHSGVVHATSYPLSVGADLCVRPAETQCVSHPFTANSQCLPRADTWVCPYGGTGRC